MRRLKFYGAVSEKRKRFLGPMEHCNIMQLEFSDTCIYISSVLRPCIFNCLMRNTLTVTSSLRLFVHSNHSNPSILT